MTIKEIKIEELHEYENNPRRNDAAVDKVAASIKEFGFKVPVVIDRDNVIIAGHTRLNAAKKIGLKTVPCIVADDLTEEQTKAFRLADNKTSELAEWDFEKLEEELAELEIDMKQFGFDAADVEWDSVGDLSESTYEEPKKEMLRCPHCGHVDSKTHFIKVDEGSDEFEGGEE